jgi:hypothetical protein
MPQSSVGPRQTNRHIRALQRCAHIGCRNSALQLLGHYGFGTFIKSVVGAASCAAQ